MANEFKHVAVGTELTQAEYESTASHVLDSQAAGDIIYASSTSQLSRLGIGTAGKILQVNSGASAPEWTATVTGVTSVLNTSLVIGRDSDNDIDFATDNTILFRASGADQIKLIDGALAPVSDNDVDLGTSSLEFKDAFFDGTVTADAFAGPLTGDVTGTADVATVATTVTITDNESTNEDNAIIFTAGGDVDGGNIGLESDGTLTYNPSTGKITATGFIGALTGNADTATALATARAINGVNFDGSAAITITAAGSTLSDTVPVSKGGTNATSLADKAVLITQDSGTDTVAAAAMSTNGQLLIGGTSGPAVGTLTAGSNVTITNADGEITIAAASSSGDITGVTLTGDDSNTASDTAGSADFTIAGGSGLTTSVSGTTLTVAGDNASTSAKGVAQFSSDNFAASSGTITIKDGGIVTAELAADAVTSAKIADDAISEEHLADDVISAQTEITSGLAAADELLYSDGGTLKKVGLDNFVELSPQLATEDTVAVASDYLLFLDGGATGNMNKESVADFVSAIAGTNLTASSGQLSAAAGGIAKAVIYRLTSSFTGDADPIASNLEKDDTRGDSTLGDDEGLGLSSGVFTFANTGTGTYLIQAHAFFGSGAADAETNLMIEVATDGSTFEQASTSQGSVYNSSARSMLTASYLFQVTNTTNDKVQFKISGNSGSNTIFGDTNINYTYFTFIKLA